VGVAVVVALAVAAVAAAGLPAAAHRAAVVVAAGAVHRAMTACVRRPMVLPAQPRTTAGAAAGGQAAAGGRAAAGGQAAAGGRAAAFRAVGQAGRGWLRHYAHRYGLKGQSNCQRL